MSLTVSRLVFGFSGEPKKNDEPTFLPVECSLIQKSSQLKVNLIFFGMVVGDFFILY